ncbi:MAG: PEP-CTERM sorting domain-containing protein, partial [Methylophilaceae bacterium]
TGTYATSLLSGSTSVTFDALVGNTAGKFSYKAAQDGFQGVGVSPLQGSEKTPGEVDIGESINATFSSNTYVSNITLGLLFDGPEYGDVNEKVQFTALYADGTTNVFVLTATGPTSATWSGSGSFIENLSPAIGGLGGVWSITNPFGDHVKSFSLTAISGSCGSAGGACNNQSDFTLISIAVPEPETYAMMLAGLAGIGFVARRKKQA